MRKSTIETVRLTANLSKKAKRAIPKVGGSEITEKKRMGSNIFKLSEFVSFYSTKQSLQVYIYLLKIKRRKKERKEKDW